MGTESRTNKKRFKRAAIPNNAKQRKRAPNTLEAIKSQAQDHVTKKKKRDHKERSFAQPLKLKVNPKEKKLKALAKKLRQIQQLEEKDASTLDEAQKAKIASKESVREQMTTLLG